MRKQFIVRSALLAVFTLFLPGPFTLVHGACPSCTGTAPVVQNVTFQSGTDCSCSGTTSLTIGPNVTVENGAVATFISPLIRIDKGTVFEEGAVVNLYWLKEPLSIELSAAPSSISADGSSYSIITAVCENGDGDPVPTGTSVTFTTNLGRFPNGTQTATLQTYDSTGILTVFLYSGTTAGTAAVEATLGSATDSVSVTFWDSGANTVSVKAVPSTLTADGESTSTITATVTNGLGDPVENGTVITFTAEHGTFTASTATTTDGVATVTYTAPSSKGDGSDTITARAPSGAEGDTAITLTGPTISTVTLSANPDAIPANGTSTSTISAAVTVEGGSAAPAGVTVTFTIKSGGGSFTGGGTQIEKETNDSGIAVATLTSSTQPGTAVIGAVADGVSAQDIEVTYEPGSLTLTIAPNSLLATGVDEAEIVILVEDADGNPVQNEEIQLILSDATLGELSDTSPVTDTSGEAEVTFTADSKGGTVTITATWNSGGTDVTGIGNITIQPPPAFMQVAEGYPDPTAINIRGTGGQSTAQIVFDVRDSSGNLVVDGYRIDFSILDSPSGGEAISPLFVTTVDGRVSTILRSGFKSGPVSVKATYYHNTSVSITTADIAIVSGPPVGEEFGIYVEYVNISGLWKMGLKNGVTVNAGDVYGNAVPDDTSISFKTYNTGGLFTPGSDGTEGGFATSDLVSAASPSPLQGFVSITGEAINGGRTTHVTALAVGSTGDSTNVVYAGTDGGGVYKSTDYGVTWLNISASSSVAGQNWIDPYVNDVAIDPENNNRVYAATGYLGDGHVYRSLDGGASWNSNNAEEYNGVFSIGSAVLAALCDDSGHYVWVGTQGNGVYYTINGTATPKITWTQAGDLADGTTVKDLVKVPSTHGATAVLYAATATGVFRSTDGGDTWSDKTEFTGDNINTLALHPDSDGTTDIIYAGTDDAGIWVSTDSGTTWTQYVDGMGKGLSASTPQAAVSNTGTGTMSTVSVKDAARSENWAVTCTSAAAGGGTFSVTGTVSGAQADYDITSGAYDIDEVSFTITAGATDFVVGDSFTFSTTRDPGMKIKDLMVDAGNDRLYAVTYFWGPLEPHAVGNVYAVELDASYEPVEPWVEATTGLPEYDPPDDTTLFAQHALVSDVPPWETGAATALYVGGEGINLYKAVTDLVNGDPQWQQSKSGLTNRIMSRMPVLFSGVCGMGITEYTGSDGETIDAADTFTSNTASFGDPDDVGATLTILSGADAGSYVIDSVDTVSQVTLLGFTASQNATDLSFRVSGRDSYRYQVYIQDTNGNPPISGSVFKVETYDVEGGFLSTVREVTYPDTYEYSGTFRDPSDSDTDDPYKITIDFSFPVAEARFTFIPTCESTVPGCSGSEDTVSYFH